MSNTAKEMVRQFVMLTLDDSYGISKEAYDLLNQMMIEDREMANILHDTIEMAVETSDGRYAINPDLM
jgi:hypothetical protein